MWRLKVFQKETKCEELTLTEVSVKPKFQNALALPVQVSIHTFLNHTHGHLILYHFVQPMPELMNC